MNTVLPRNVTTMFGLSRKISPEVHAKLVALARSAFEGLAGSFDGKSLVYRSATINITEQSERRLLSNAIMLIVKDEDFRKSVLEEKARAVTRANQRIEESKGTIDYGPNLASVVIIESMVKLDYCCRIVLERFSKVKHLRNEIGIATVECVNVFCECMNEIDAMMIVEAFFPNIFKMTKEMIREERKAARRH